VAQLFDEWATALARGEQPDPLGFIRRAGAGADELAGLMDRFLRARPRAEPDPELVELAREWIAGTAPLAQLRARQRLRQDDVVDLVLDEFDLAPAKRATVKRYYQRLESGQLDPARLSRPLVGFLARVLKISAPTIVSWRPRSLEAAPAYRAIPTATAAEPLLRAASVTRDPAEDDDEVRALFIADR
jgi:hypothetical protein